MNQPQVQSFFDTPSHSFSHVVFDPLTRHAAVFDPVLDYDPASGRIGHACADRIIAWVRAQQLQVDWVIDTHVHADHLSAAPYIKQRLGGRIGIGEYVREVQRIFGQLFNAGVEFARDGSQFDHLFKEGEQYAIGQLDAQVLHTPGHTPACTAHLIGDIAVVGDTLLMPDYGTARCDFTGGDARLLYRSIQRLLALPEATRLLLCHDYLVPGREHYVGQTTVGEQRRDNIHVHAGVDEDAFVRMRRSRDVTLAVPQLLWPAVQVNMRAGQLPPAESNGLRYLKIPLNAL
jgi:glyoxylase-like metal-dependent hydrolase (beta-lactamase superfamily II)